MERNELQSLQELKEEEKIGFLKKINKKVFYMMI